MKMIRLYAIDKKGKVRVFKGLAFEDPVEPRYIVSTDTGILGGNLTNNKIIISKGKQKRSMKEQADFQLQSLVNEKIDEGYKSFEQLLQRFQDTEVRDFEAWSQLEPQEDVMTVNYLYTTLKIKYNTNSMWLPLPMLAEKWKEKKKSVTYPRLVQPKLNGMRCLSIYEKRVKLLSRGGQLIKMPHIEEALRPFLEQFPHIQLDGELYRHGMPLQYITGIVKLEDPEQFHRKLPIEYHIYDVAIENMNQATRQVMLSAYNFNDPSIKIVKTVTTIGEVATKAWHDQFVADGYEGAMVRDPDAFYLFGFRDACLLKMKEFIDEEFEIIGGNVEDGDIKTFVFILKNNIDDQEFRAKPTGTLEDRAVWWDNLAHYIGKKATVRYQERTQGGLPHQAHLRHKDTEILIEAVRDYE